MATTASPQPFTTNSASTNSSPSSPSPLRLMCSFNGRILPRPSTKSLCYLGGETRIISIPRHTSLSDLKSKLSLSVLSNRPFTLKYQLPNEDLDALITVSTDDDLDNMIDEYDRLSSSPSSPRLRLFLFPAQLESSASSTVGSLLDEDFKDDSWFVDALNGARSEAMSVNSLLGIEGAGEEAAMRRPESMGKLASGRESPMIDKMSSFGSNASAPALSNLPPITDRPDELEVMESCRTVEKVFDEGFKEPQPPSFTPQLIRHAVSLTNSGVSTTENSSRVFSDDEKPDRGGGGVGKTLQVSKAAQVDSFVPEFGPRAVFLNGNSDSNANYQNPMPEQQYIPVNTHYIQQPGMGTLLPIPSFYQPITAQQIQQSQQVAPQYDPQVPVYYVPVRPNTSYNLATVPTATIGDHNLMQSAGKAAVPVAQVPLKHELPTNMYRPSAVAAASPAVLQQPTIHAGNDQSRPYAGIGYQVLQQHQISQAPATLANYGYEYTSANSMHPHVYYSQGTSQPAVLPQFQTVSSGVVTADTMTGNTKATRAS